MSFFIFLAQVPDMTLFAAKLRFCFGDLCDVKCRLKAWPRFNFPLPVKINRFDAAFFVFNAFLCPAVVCRTPPNNCFGNACIAVALLSENCLDILADNEKIPRLFTLLNGESGEQSPLTTCFLPAPIALEKLPNGLDASLLATCAIIVKRYVQLNDWIYRIQPT